MTHTPISNSGPGRLDLKNFFPNAEDYVILRISDQFPDYADGADVDILCARPISFLRHILEKGTAYEKVGYTVRVQASGSQLHVDFFPPQAGKLLFRFDLIDSFSMYDKVAIDPRYARDVLARSQEINRQGIKLRVPDLEDDLVLRFLEYIQFIQQRPEKKKHLDYVRQAGRLDFLKRLEAYSDLQVAVTTNQGEQQWQVSRKAKPAPTSFPRFPSGEEPPFYNLAPTCQIPGLARYYEEFFSQRGNGLFVEVGAYDGDYVSNTSGLADLGWTGYYIEPVPQFFEKCRSRHARNPKVTVSNCAIGAQREKICLHVGGPLTTANSTMRDHFKTLGWAKQAFHSEEMVEAEQFTLHHYLTSQKIEPGFEILIIDVEGGEWNVLKDFPIQQWKPQMVIIELHDQNQDYVLIHDQCRQIVRYFEQNYYYPVYKDGTNTIYVSREKLMARRERMDYFLIWGHGLDHSEDIIQCLRRRQDLDILAIHRKTVNDLSRFVQDLYACDTVPFQHLRSKTRYLLTTPKEILFILARNNNPQERFYGQGAFRHLQCALIKDIKEEVRDAYNPRVDGRRTEDHLIHGSDYEKQVIHALKILELPPLAHYQRQPHPDLNLPYHLAPIANYRICDIPLEKIRARILDLGDVPIEQTPHYAFVRGDQRPYVEYHRRHAGRELTDDHFPSAFDKLIRNFNYDKRGRGKPGFAVVKSQGNGTYLLQDGVHRAAILKHQGAQTVRVIEILPADHPSRTLVLVFSKDRAMQLDATLRSFRLHCQDANPRDIYVLYKTGTERHRSLYQVLQQEHPQVNFIPEADFKAQIIQHLRLSTHILFLVDDCLFVRDFSLAAILQDLKRFPNALGFSLRLGQNTTYCYPHDQPQTPPLFESIREGVLKYGWSGAEYDFGYPLEVSSSVYRSADLLPLLTEKNFHNPNTLEGVLASHVGLFKAQRPSLLCFDQSAAFCAPLNKVQSEYANRAGHQQAYSTEDLANRYAAGYRINILACNGFRPGACHQEVSLELAPPPDSPATSRDLIPAASAGGSEIAVSVIILCTAQTHQLTEAIESITVQTFASWEIIIVLEGSPNPSSAVARHLMSQYSDRRMRLLQKTAGGRAEACNAGVRAACGRYLLCLDGDDKLAPSFLELTAGLLDQNPGIAVAYTDQQCFEGSTDRIEMGEFGLNLLQENCVPYCALFRRTLWEALGGYNPNLSLGSEDWDFWIGAVEHGFKGGRLPQAFFLRRIRPPAAVPPSGQHRQRSQARIILNHPSCYDEATRRQAEDILHLDPLPSPPSLPIEISVIIPCYRQAHFLPDAVESVAVQTWSDWEIIIVNDGSPDQTGEVAERFISQYPDRIILLEKQNGGLSSARNAGIRAAQGAYVCLLDADDKMQPTMLEKTRAVLDNHPKVGFAYGHIQHFGDLNTVFPLPVFNRDTLIYKDNIVCVNSLVRKSVWQQVGGFDETMREGYEDWNFWISCVEHGWTGYCVPEPLFCYRKSGRSMLADANQKRERLIARIVLNHPKLYDENQQAWARKLLESSVVAAKPMPTAEIPGIFPSPASALPSHCESARRSLRLTYLISSILGITGGNQTLLRQAEEMGRRGHTVTIITYTPKPDWFQFNVRVVQVPSGKSMAQFVPPSDVVIATYLTNAAELRAVTSPVKVYYAQGDQYVFADTTLADTDRNHQMRVLSRASYQIPGIRFVPNSRNLADAVEKQHGRRPDRILPVCTDQTIFRPLQRSLPGSRLRILIVGPDTRGSATEPLLFKGIQDIHDALKILSERYSHFTAVRMSSSGPEIFRQFPCEFYTAPSDEMKTMLYGTAHLLIYASHYDSCPRPPQEAMAAGCAVVCTATSGALEYCRHEENALLVPIQSPSAIADAVERLIRDPALRERLIQGGLATAREFPREREWNEWEQMLYQFMDEAGTRSPETNIADNTAENLVAPIPGEGSAECPLPDCAFVGHLAQGLELYQAKKLPEAWQSTLAGLELRPFHPEAYLLLASIAIASGDAHSARRCARFAQELAPEWKAPRQFLKGSLKGHAKPKWLKLPESLRQPPLGAGRHRISVCMIVKNEEQFLGQCLTSIKELAHQIVLVDTGSTDRTVEIAREFGAEVHHFAWRDDFSAARNAALQHAKGDWILILDADEVLPSSQHENLRKDIANDKMLAYRLPLVNQGREAHGRNYVPRLFRNVPGAYYQGRIHEQVFSSLIRAAQGWGMSIGIGSAEILHHGYTDDITKDRNKVERNLMLLKQAIVEQPNNAHISMSLGIELFRTGDMKNGEAYCRKSFQIMSQQSPSEVVPELRETLLSQYALHLYREQKYQEVIDLLNSPLAQRDGLTSSLHMVLGLAHFELKQYDMSAEQMRKCLQTLESPTFAPVNTSIYTAGPHLCLALSLVKLGDIPGAEKEFQAGLLKKGNVQELRLNYAKMLNQWTRPTDALKQLHAIISENPEHAEAWCLGGTIALSQPHFLEFACDWTEEAVQHLPHDATLWAQRAEALLLSQESSASLQWWARLGAQDKNPKFIAALILCSIVENSPLPATPPGSDIPALNRAFMTWYRKCLHFGASNLLQRLHSQAGFLQAILPDIAQVIKTISTEIERPVEV